MSSCLVIDLGLIGYAQAWELQKRAVAARKAGAVEDVLLFCEHPHVITLGRNGNRSNLLATESVLRQKSVEYFETSRGGDITYHGPGQLVGYPILNLGAIKRDIVWYVRQLEEIMIRASADFGITAQREAGKTGIWVDCNSPAVIPSGVSEANEVEESLFDRSASGSSLATRHSPLATTEKLAAIGVHISRWVTSHGFAYNVATDLRYFDLIVPCGIAERKATSLEKLLQRQVRLEDAKRPLTKHFGEVFELEMKTASAQQWVERLEEAERAVAVPA